MFEFVMMMQSKCIYLVMYKRHVLNYDKHQQ